MQDNSLSNTRIQCPLHDLCCCLCELNPEYMPLNNWGHGCAVITIDEGQASVQNIRIQNGQVI